MSECSNITLKKIARKSKSVDMWQRSQNAHIFAMRRKTVFSLNYFYFIT